jgi:hypothetical protein
MVSQQFVSVQLATVLEVQRGNAPPSTVFPGKGIVPESQLKSEAQIALVPVQQFVSKVS